MTTNGYYLDQQFRQELPSLGIRHVQVTLDGNQPDHDQLRVQRNGRGSFDHIFANILSFSQVEDDTKLTLRVNCTDTNFDGISALLRKLPPQVKRSASIFFRWVWSNEASGNREFSEQRRGELPYQGLAELYDDVSSLGRQIVNPHGSA